MDSGINREQRFASFILDSDKDIEIAIHAEDVLEATPISDKIQPLPDAAPYLEGFMRLRDDVIPVINMKKRLGLSGTDYATDAKVAVVSISQIRLGLLFDDIQDVLMVGSDAIDPIHPVLCTGEGIISDLIKLAKGKRTLELLNLKRLLGNGDSIELMQEVDRSTKHAKAHVQQAYSRFVVFSSMGREYGVPVDQVQEITFLSQIDDVFKNDAIEGVVQLRENSIPVINAARLLDARHQKPESGEDTRVLVLDANVFRYGLIVDSVREILSISDDAIMPLPRNGHETVSGIYQREDGRNVMLLQVDKLIESQRRELRSVARLKSAGDEGMGSSEHLRSRHLITADSYLLFSIGRKFAVELNDVQEIIEPKDLMELPATTGFDCRVLNLRGAVVPVINLRAFYGLVENDVSEDKKLIIARKQGCVIAIEVDSILTIHKQVQYKQTPSLNPQLAAKKDTLDRLIEFVGESGVLEHVLVINIEAIMNNHLNMISHNTPHNKIIDCKIDI